MMWAQRMTILERATTTRLYQLNLLLDAIPAVKYQRPFTSGRGGDTFHQTRIEYYNNNELPQQKQSQNKHGSQQTSSLNTSFPVPSVQQRQDTRNNQRHHHRHQKDLKTQRQQQQQQEKQQQTHSLFQRLQEVKYAANVQNESMPCRQFLDLQHDSGLPTSQWVHLDGTLPLTSLDEVLTSIEEILREELEKGVMDLDALWNPLEDRRVPLVPFSLRNDEHNSNPQSEQQQQHRVQAAQVVLSPFGRPSGWYLKLASPSMVQALLNRAESKERVRVTWKMVLVKEHHPGAIPKQEDTGSSSSSSTNNSNRNRRGNRKQSQYIPTNRVGDFLVDNTMVRFENCPDSLDEEHLRYLLSRYELARFGPTVLQWQGKSNDGKQHKMFVVRFHTAAWARAAVREKQDMEIAGRGVRLIQYPNQLLVEEEEEKEQMAV